MIITSQLLLTPKNSTSATSSYTASAATGQTQLLRTRPYTSTARKILHGLKAGKISLTITTSFITTSTLKQYQIKNYTSGIITSTARREKFIREILPSRPTQTLEKPQRISLKLRLKANQGRITKSRLLRLMPLTSGKLQQVLQNFETSSNSGTSQEYSCLNVPRQSRFPRITAQKLRLLLMPQTLSMTYAENLMTQSL